MVCSLNGEPVLVVKDYLQTLIIIKLKVVGRAVVPAIKSKLIDNDFGDLQTSTISMTLVQYLEI
jgi:hypothetical protein